MRLALAISVAIGLLPAVGCGSVESGEETRDAQGPPVEPWASDERELTLLNTYDAFGAPREGLTQNFGFSTVIRYGGKTILFDAGSRADILAENLRRLGVSPSEIDYAVASHRHHDHIAGFDYILAQNPKIKLFLPPDFFGFGAPLKFSFGGKEPDAGASLEQDQRYFAGKLDPKDHEIVSTGRFWKADITWVRESTEIAKGLRVLLTRSELMGTFVRYPPNGEKAKLIGMPELSLTLTTSKGTVLVVGCSHSSVEEIVKGAVAAGPSSIDLVLGGFHLLPYTRSYVTQLATRLKTTYGVASVAPAHCTGHVAFDEFRKVYGDAYRFFGLGSKIEY